MAADNVMTVPTAPSETDLDRAMPWFIGGGIAAVVAVVAVAALRQVIKYEEQGSAFAYGPARNREGLTFVEWVNAAAWPEARQAGLTGAGASEPELAWQAGEDPTEYRGQPRARTFGPWKAGLGARLNGAW